MVAIDASVLESVQCGGQLDPSKKPALHCCWPQRPSGAGPSAPVLVVPLPQYSTHCYPSTDGPVNVTPSTAWKPPGKPGPLPPQGGSWVRLSRAANWAGSARGLGVTWIWGQQGACGYRGLVYSWGCHSQPCLGWQGAGGNDGWQ